MKENLRPKKIAPVIVIIGVIIIPLLYSYFYLGAFWDPYSSLDTLPVAIVNDDKGAVINEEERNLGNEMCDELKEDASLKFVFTDVDTAKAGMEGKKYYATITIPENFSESVKSAETADKQTAVITYTPNEKRNYLASQILNNAVSTIEKSVRSNINGELTAKLSDELTSVPDELNKLSDGLDQLYDGSVELFNGTGDLKSGALDLQTGAGKLSDGTRQLKDGAVSLQEGITSLAAGADKLSAGSSELKEGTKSFQSKMSEYQSGMGKASKGGKVLSDHMADLDEGIASLLTGAKKLETSTENITELSSGAKSLAAGASQLNTGLVSYADGVDTLIANVMDTTNVLAAYAQATGDKTISALAAKLASEENVSRLKQLKGASETLKTASAQISSGAARLLDSTADMSQLKTAIGQLKTGLETAKTGSGTILTGTQTLSGSLNQLNTAAKQLSNASVKISTGAAGLDSGIASLQSGTKELSTGAGTLTDGTAGIDEGARALKAGTDKLVNGASDLQEGAEKLNDGIKTAKDGVEDSITDAGEQIKNLNGLEEYAKDPVEVIREPYAPVPNYGTAFAPYFMSLSLWVGGLMIFFGIYLDADEKFKLLSRNSGNKVARTFIYLFIGFLQAVILGLVLLFGLGLKVNHLGMFFVSCILVSLVFISIIQFFLIFFKDIGKFLSLALLILQLTSCGGTFPMETVPGLFNALYPFMPMTYSVGLFKEAISGAGSTSLAWYNAGILMIIFFVFLGSTLLFTGAKKVKESRLTEAEA